MPLVRQILTLQLEMLRTVGKLCDQIVPAELFRQISIGNGGREAQTFSASELFQFLQRLPVIYSMHDCEVICSGLQVDK